MIYNGANELDCKRAKERLNYMIDKKKLFKIVQKREQRSLKQNQYLHLILSWFAHEYGETVQYVKHHFFKITVNPDLFLTQHVNHKQGTTRIDYRSTADLTTKEMTEAIDNFKQWASIEAGIYLPDANEDAELRSLEYELNKYK